MKLGSLKNDTRDGALCVVSRDLGTATVAFDVAPTLQAALDDWDFCGPRLAELFDDANRKPAGSRWFEPDFTRFMAPLPRAYQRLVAGAYPSHAERLGPARADAPGRGPREEPPLRQGASDAFLGPRDPIPVESADWAIDFGAGLAVVLGDVPVGVKRERAAEHIRLVVLAHELALRELAPVELARGSGLVQSQPWASFAPLAVTPDELGAAWDGRRIQLAVKAHVNGRMLGQPNAGADMAFDFPRLVAYAARTRPLSAGTILASGTVSNRDAKLGACSIAEQRALETLEHGAPRTPFLAFGDRIEIVAHDADGRAIFGAIEQEVVRAGHPRAAAAAAAPATAAS